MAKFGLMLSDVSGSLFHRPATENYPFERQISPARLRSFLKWAGAMGGAEEPVASRARVIIDNDFGGDPDGLFQLAHHVLSPSVEIRGVIGSLNHPHGFYGSPGSSEYAVTAADALLKVLGVSGKVPLLRGAGKPLPDPNVPSVSEASRFIVQEAMRDDVKTPLYVVCGAGLTDLASAYLTEPRIANRLTLVWIGGPEYGGDASAPSGKPQMEYNLSIDLRAAQVVFNVSTIPVWQVPRDAYRSALVSCAELERRIGSGGKLGRYLLGRLRDLEVRANWSLGETYVLGDSPLVLLTALQAPWGMDPSSSKYVSRKAPFVSDDGLYTGNPNGRPIRVYTDLDTRLMFEDFYAKVMKFDSPVTAAGSCGNGCEQNASRDNDTAKGRP